MQREQGVLLQGLRMARPWKPPLAVSKRLLRYGGLRKGKGWGTCKVAGNRSVRGGRRRLAAGGGLWPPGQPNQSRGRAALRAAGPCFVRASRARRPPAWPQRSPHSPGLPRPATGRSRPAGGGTNPVEVRRSLRSQHNHRDQPKEQDQQPHNHAQHDPDGLVAGGGCRLGQRLPVLGQRLTTIGA